MIAVGRGKLKADEALSLSYEALTIATRTFDPAKLDFFAYSKPFLRGYVSKSWERDMVVKNSHKAHPDYHEKPMRLVRDALDCPTSDSDWDPFVPVTYRPPLEPDFVPPEYELINIKERWAVVQPLLRILSEQERTILRLHYEGGFTCEDIARLLVPKVTKQAIHIAYDRALRKLRNNLFHKKLLFKL
jgi:RNA polymerase sigma factor (sigma-70 family)